MSRLPIYTPIDELVGDGSSAAARPDSWAAARGKIEANFQELYGGGLYPALGRAPVNRNVAILGDSRTFQCTANTPGSEFSKLAQGWLGWLQFLTRQRFDFDIADNFGVSGDTTRQMLARVPAMLAATKAATIFVLGAINDRGTANMTYQATMDNLTQIRDMCRANGRRVVIFAELPKGDSVNTSVRLTGSQLKIHLRVRQALLDWRTEPGVYVVDPWQSCALITSTTGDWASVNETKDGLHPAPLGAYHVALPAVPVVNAIFPPVDILPWSNTDQYDATDFPNGCLNSNPMMTGTGGTFNATGGSGNVADGWSENAGPTWTRAYSKVTGSDGKTWQQVVLGGTGTTGGVSLRQVLSNIAVGDKVEAFMDVEIDPSVANVSQFALQLLDNNAITSGDFRRALSTEVFPNTTDTIKGIMRTPKYVFTTTTAQLQINMLAVNGGAVSGTFRVGRIASRKVI
jgi:lysophospholipase L1-like esterase